MSRATRAPRRATSGAGSATRPARPRRGLPERVVVGALLFLHAALLAWGIGANSVTYDENTHLASGVAAVARGDLWISVVNPPLIKAACGAAALAAGAVAPSDSALALYHDPFVAAESFMRRNAGRYTRIFTAARLVIAALSLVLGLLTWAAARAWWGPAAGALALALYAFNPELLAHGGLASLDVATALGFFAMLATFLRFVRTGRGRDFAALAVATGFTALVRFTVWLALAILVALAALAIARRVARAPRRLVLGTLLLFPAALLALQAGYPGGTSWRPLRAWTLESRRFVELQHSAPGLVLPLPDAYLAGLDHQAFESQPGITPTYLLGRITRERVPSYSLIAIAVKWPLALWAALVAAAGFAIAARGGRGRDARRGRRADAPRGAPLATGTPPPAAAAPPLPHGFLVVALLAIPVALVAVATFAVQLNVGVRYLLPALPPLIVLAAGGILGRPGGAPRASRFVAATLVAVAVVETALAAPYYLSFYNLFGGGPGNGDRIVNDSNVDLGQGLLALRRDMARLGIRRIHLAYHGTSDPAVYGIDYVPYLGGSPGPESDWIAVSSYYFVGLSQRMMTPRGRTPFVQLDFRALWGRMPQSRPARCMYLFRIR